jgi:hypothetical protein
MVESFPSFLLVKTLTGYRAGYLLESPRDVTGMMGQLALQNS